MAGHAASPNSETTERVTPGSQNATSTVPSRLASTPVIAGGDNSEATKIVRGSSC